MPSLLWSLLTGRVAMVVVVVAVAMVAMAAAEAVGLLCPEGPWKLAWR